MQCGKAHENKPGYHRGANPSRINADTKASTYCCLFPAVVGGVILLPLTFQEYSAILYSNLYSNNISGLPHPTTK